MTYGQQPYGGYPNGPQSQYTMRQQARDRKSVV